MKKYAVYIEVYESQIVQVKADSKREAEDIARDMVACGEVDFGLDEIWKVVATEVDKEK